MTQPRKRLTALILALLLSLTGLVALAEAVPAVPTIQTSLNLDINHAALAEILSQVTVSQDEGEQTALFDAAGLEGLDILLTAIDKLWLRTITGPGLSTLSLETEEDVLFDLQLVDDAEGDLATVTTNVLPGVGIRVPKDVLQDFIQVLPTTEALVTQPEMGQAYTDAIEAYFVSQVPSLEAAVPGSYEIEDAGVFTTRTSFEVDSHMILGLGTALLEVFKQDSAAQEAVTFLLASAAAEGQAEAKPEGAEAAEPVPQDAQALISSIEQAIAEAAKEENRKLGTQTIYESENGLRTYTETLINAQEQALPRLLIAVLNDDGENGKDNLNRVTIITDNPDGESHSQAEPDWTALRHAIIDGSNQEDAMIVMSSQTAEFEPQQKRLHNSQISLQDHNGTYAIVSGTMTDLQDGSEEGSTSLYLLANEPLISVYYTKKPLGEGEVPALPAVEGRVDVHFGDGVDAQEETDLTAVFNDKGLPNLIVNIAQSFPEETERLLTLLLTPAQPAE